MGRLIEALNKAEQAKLKSDTLQTDSAKKLRLADARPDSEDNQSALTLEQAVEPSYKKYSSDAPPAFEPDAAHGRQPSPQKQEQEQEQEYEQDQEQDESRRHTDKSPARTLELIPIHRDQPNNKKNIWLAILLLLVVIVLAAVWYLLSASATTSNYPDMSSNTRVLSDQRLGSDQPQPLGDIGTSVDKTEKPSDSTLGGESEIAAREQFSLDALPALTQPSTSDTPVANVVASFRAISDGILTTASSDNSRAAPAAAKKPVFQITQSRSLSGAESSLSYARDQIVGGEPVAATLEYQELLRNQPTNIDALTGLAKLQFQLGNIEAAQTLYTTLLQLDPKNPIALLGSVQSRYANDSGAQESALTSLLEQYPTRPSLSFALGNFYSSQARWSDAQAQYSNALMSASANGTANPDYAFNLGIAYEQLGQPNRALAAYREAQQLTTYSSAGFDLNTLNTRLQSLGRGF